MRIERQIHHYGSGLNALPLITAFESSPTDYYLLRVGHAGLSGPLSNIDQGGFAAASFHSFADTVCEYLVLKRLPLIRIRSSHGMHTREITGKSTRAISFHLQLTVAFFSPNFSGLSMGTGTTLINHPDFGWQAFGGIVTATSPAIQVQIRDPVRRRVFIAPIAALLTLDAGAFSTISYTPSTQTVVVTVTPTPDGSTGAASAPNARLVISQTAVITGVPVLKPTTTFPMDAGAIVITYQNGVGQITLVA
jgi:hypothetical protein